MMEYYFTGGHRLEELEGELESWVDTPFRHRTGVKGLGCDCIHYIKAVLNHFGLIRDDPKRDMLPEYDFDWNLHSKKELLLEGIKREVNCIEVGDDDITNGDLVLFKFGRASAHVAFYLKDYLYHSITGIGVVKSQFKSGEWSDRVTHVLRIIE